MYRETTRTLLFMLLRFVFYVAASLLCLQLLVELAQQVDPHLVFKENGFLERTHFTLPLLTALLLLLNHHKAPEYQPLLRIWGLLALFAAIRELDHFLDMMLFPDAYKYLNALVLGGVIYVFWRERHRLIDSLTLFSQAAPMYFFMAGFLMVTVYAQIIGQKELWMAILDEHFIRTAKSAVEESAETMGYLLIVFGAIETWFLPKQVHSESKDLKSVPVSPVSDDMLSGHHK